MKASGKRILSMLMSALIFVSSIFVYASFVKPTYSQIKDLRAEVSSRLNFIDKHENYIQEVQRILNEYQDVARITETTSLILPLSQDAASGLNQINGLSALNHLVIELLSVQQLSITPSSQQNSIKGVGTLRFNFRLAGKYEDFKSFLQAVETNITLMDLVSLKIEPTLGAAGADSFYYTITLDTYYQAE